MADSDTIHTVSDKNPATPAAVKGKNGTVRRAESESPGEKRSQTPEDSAAAHTPSYREATPVSADPLPENVSSEVLELAKLVEDCRTEAHGDYRTLARFLRAEDGDTESAARRFRVTQDWRLQHRVDGIGSLPYPFEEAYVWMAPHG